MATQANIYSDEELLEALKQADKVGASSCKKYSIFARNNGLPTQRTIMIRLGTWNEAKRAAGLTSISAPRRSYSRYSEEEIRQAIERCALSLGRIPSYDDYERWSPLEVNAPAGSLIRQRLGSWITAREIAKEYLNE